MPAARHAKAVQDNLQDNLVVIEVLPWTLLIVGLIRSGSSFPLSGGNDVRKISGG